MKLADVSPVSNLARAYATQLDAAVSECEKEHSPEPLFGFCRQWAELAPDAQEQVEADGFSWKHLRDAMSMERRGRFAGEDAARRFGHILMPDALFDAGMIAMQFGCPDGLALRRMVDQGLLVMKDGSLRRAKQ